MNKIKGFLLGTLLGVAMVAGAQSLYYGWNPATGFETIHGGLIDGSSPQTITGCSVNPATIKGGTNFGEFTAGSGTCAVTLTDVAAPNGYTCIITDRNTGTRFPVTSASRTGCTTSTVAISNGDVINYLMFGY